MPGAAGNFVVGLFGNAANQVGGGPMGALGQFGNLIAQTGLQDYNSVSRIYISGFLDAGSYSIHRQLLGIVGSDLIPAQMKTTRIDENGRCAIDHLALSTPRTTNDWVLTYTKPYPTNDELNRMLLRGAVTDEAYIMMLRANCYGESGLMQAYSNMRFEIPGPSDLIRFAVRDAFDPIIVQKFGYHKELPVSILPYMEQQGFGGQLGVAIPPGATTTVGPEMRQTAQWFDMYWWSHWDLPSVGQGFEMLHRLYPDSPHGPSPSIVAGATFTMSDMETLLKASDYPDYWRPRLTAISYSPLTRVDTRRMFDLGILNETGVYHQYRAQGYNHQDAEGLVEFSKELRDLGRISGIKAKTFALAKEGYLNGTLEWGDAANMIYPWVKNDAARDAYKDIWDMEYLSIKIRERTSAIKSAYLSGANNANTTRNALIALGLSFTKANDKVQTWKIQLEGKRKYISAATNVEYFLHGFLSLNDLQLRLMNLHYNQSDIQTTLNYAQAKRADLIGKQIEKGLREAEKKAKENVKLILSAYTDANIKAMFKKGQLSALDIVKILKLREWKKSAIERWMNTYLSIDPEDFPEIENDENSTDDFESESEDENENADVGSES